MLSFIFIYVGSLFGLPCLTYLCSFSRVVVVDFGGKSEWSCWFGKGVPPLVPCIIYFVITSSSHDICAGEITQNARFMG